MINLMRRSLLINFQNYSRIQRAHVAYQFKVDRPVYYPNRQTEMQRMSEQLKSQLVTDNQEQQKLPRDYYYKILGVKKCASTQQIKAAYYGLAKRFHPDAGQRSRESKHFQEISNAYNILTDETKRLEYDQLGVVKDEQSFLRSKGLMANMVVGNKKVDMPMATNRDDLLQMANGEPRLELSFLEAAHGLKKSIDLRFLKKCPTCNGKSPKLVSRSNPELCRKCNGSGQLTKKTATYTSLTACDQCQGKRYINRNQCETCDNRGIVMETVKVVVPVPAGVKTGDTVSIENPKTKQRVNYRVQVLESDYYKREGNDLHTDKYISISEAVLGGMVKVRGINDYMDVKLDAGVESHSKVVMKGKGIKTRDGVGDHIVTFKVRIPKSLSMKQRQLMLALSKTEDHEFEVTE